MSFGERVPGIRGLALIVAASLSVLLVAGPASAAQHLEWMVARAVGSVAHGAAADRMQPTRLGDRLPPGTLVDTGPDGRVTIVRGRDTVSAGPGARFIIAGDPDEPPDSIVQRLGRILFDMETRESRSFGVDTPLLAVTIKGTRFTVDVTASQDAVAVDEGIVLVTARDSGETVLVEAGFTAVVTAVDGNLEVRPTETRAETTDPVDSLPDIDTSLADAVDGTLGDAAAAVTDTAAAAGDAATGAAAGAAGTAEDVGRSVERSVSDTVGGVAGGLP